MALMKCPECGNEVSDQAKVCVHCGYPISDYLKARAEEGEPKGETIPEIRESGYEYSATEKFQKSKEQSAEKKPIISKNVKCFVLVCVVIIVIICVAASRENDSDYSLQGESQTDGIMLQETEESLEESESVDVSQLEVESTEADNQFVSELAAVSSEPVAETAYDILVNQIGLETLTFDSQMGETSNYKFYGNGTAMIITAMTDYYRVFIPDSDYTFYEDGKVLMTAQEYADATIDQYEASKYYILAKDAVEQHLKNPDSADFPSIVTHPEEIAFAKIGDIITVQSYVEAKNSFNATVKCQWTVQFVVLDESTYSYDLKYINIDGEESGEYTDVD